MDESLKRRIQRDIADTMRARDKPRLAVFRMMSVAIKQQEVDTCTTLDDVALLVVLERMIKQRRDSADQFREGGCLEPADGEAFEIGIIQAYMPTSLMARETAMIIEAAITETGAVSPVWGGLWS